MGPIFELAITLPPKGSRNRLRALHRQLRAAILDGRLQCGLRLPATRALAAALGVSRNTIIAAYDLLLSEGYLLARPGAGTFVANAPPQASQPVTATNGEGDPRLAAFWRVQPATRYTPCQAPFRFDFLLGVPDTASFPFHIWRRLAARAQQAFAKAPSAYVEIEGRAELREAIAKHVSFARAVACRTEDVVVTTGTQQGIDLIARILVTPGQTVVAFEDPGYPPMRAAFAASGAEIAAVPIDGEGLRVDLLPANTRVICVAPSHQFPLGVAMSPRRRMALLEFARDCGAVVVEDDYDSEFRFGGRPLDALQTLDRTGAVFYVGTFSKSLFPALRLGFVVVPPWARAALVRAKRLTDWHSPMLTQDTLTAFVAEGHLARHIRRMRKVYGDRCALLLAALAHHCGNLLEPIPAAAGMHLAARLRVPAMASTVTARAAAAGIRIEAIETFAVARPAENGLVLGYGKIEAGQISAGVRHLARIIKEEASSPGCR